MKGARHQPVDQHEDVEHQESFNVPIKQKLIQAKNQACDACGTFKSNHPTMTSALMLIAVFCLGIVTSAAVGKMFVSNSHYYVSTDPHAREIHQALDTLLGHYRSGKGAADSALGAASHTAKSYYHAAKGAGESAYYGGKEGMQAGVESAKAGLDGALASVQGLFHTPNKYDAKAAKEGLLASLSPDKLSSKFGDASDYASAKLAAAQESLLAAKDAANDKIQDTLHPERHAENQFMKVLHEAEHKIAKLIKG